MLAVSEGPDQTARMRRLILALAVRIRPKTFSHGAAHPVVDEKSLTAVDFSPVYVE